MKISRIFANLPLVDIGLRPLYSSEVTDAARRSQQYDRQVTLYLDKDGGTLPDFEFPPYPPEKYFRDVTSMGDSIKITPSLFADEPVIRSLYEQFSRIENLRSAVLNQVPVGINKNLNKIAAEIRKAVLESQSEYALIMLDHEMRDEAKSESELEEALEFFRWRSRDLSLSNREPPKDLDENQLFAESINQSLYRDFGFVLHADYIVDLLHAMKSAKLDSKKDDPLLFAMAHEICKPPSEKKLYFFQSQIDFVYKPLNLTDYGEYNADTVAPLNFNDNPTPDSNSLTFSTFPESRDTKQLSDQINEARAEIARILKSDKVVLSGIHLLAYILLPNRQAALLNFIDDDRTIETENKLNPLIVNDQVIVHPIVMLGFLRLLRGIGVEYDDLEMLIEDVLITPNPGFQTSRHAFKVKTHTFSLKSVLNISAIDRLLILLKSPADLAKEVLATYQINIPEDLLPEIANHFKEDDIAQAKGKRDEYFTDSETGNANAARFLSFLLKKLGGKTMKERLGLWLAPILGKNTLPEKRWRLGLVCSILVSLTLFKKYGFTKSRKILSLKGNIGNLSADEQASAVLELQRFFYGEFAEVVKEESAYLPSQKFAESLRGQIVSGKPLWELLFHKTVWSHFKYLEETANALKTIIGPAVEVEFLPARTKLDAFIGFFADLSIRSKEVIRHILSDPKLHTVRILVNKKYQGGMMIYEATVKKEEALIVGGINAHCYFNPQQFVDHLMIFLKKEAASRGCRYILLPQYPSNQSHDTNLRQELMHRVSGTVTTDQEIRFPRQGAGNNSKKDFYGNGHEHNPFLVLEDLKGKQ